MEGRPCIDRFAFFRLVRVWVVASKEVVREGLNAESGSAINQIVTIFW